MSQSQRKNKGKEDKSPRIPQRDKIKESFLIKDFTFTEKQNLLIEILLNKETKVVFVDGVAGTGKTLVAVYAALKLLNDKRITDLIYVRTIIESAVKGLGSLPGEMDMKFKPFMLPLEDKLDELLNRADIDRLLKDDRITAIPVNFLRGASFNAKFIVSDESQNFTFKELTTLITRLGKFSKLAIIGDSRQSDVNGKSGFKDMFSLFDNEESAQNGVYTFKFEKEDIMRSEILKFIIEKIENYENTKRNNSL